METQPGRTVTQETLEEMLQDVVPLPPKEERISVLAEHDRLTASFQMHLENCCDKAQTGSAKFSTLTESQGVQIYARRIVIPTDWQPLNLGWVADEAQVGFILLQNDCDLLELKRRQLLRVPEGEEPLPPLPTIEISVNGNDQEPDLYIEPGQFNVYTSKRFHLWRIRSSGEKFKAKIAVFPR